MPTLDELLQRSTQRHAERPALAWEGRLWTYRELDEAVTALAARLAGDVRPGQRVGVLAPNTPALVAGLWAAWRLEAVAVPLNARWRDYELGRILADAQPSVVLSTETFRGYSFVDLFDDLWQPLPALRRWLLFDPLGRDLRDLPGPAATEAEPLPPGVGCLLYTSGTTGAPKGALVPHATEVDAAPVLSELLGLLPEDVSVFVIPVAHAFGLGALIATLASGGLAVLAEGGFSLAPLTSAIREYRPTVLHGSPALFASFLKTAPPDPRPLRTGLVAGAACPPPVLEQLDRLGVRILNLYGMTEIGAATCCRPDDPPEVRYRTVGRPLPGYDLRIAAGTPGEVQVRGSYVTAGYFRQPEATREAFDGDWFRTGDLGTWEAHGNLTIAGRIKDVIHVGGLNVFPAEVEGFLLTHPQVAQAAVLGVPHPVLGEVVQAVVVPRPGARLTATALLQYAREHIAGYKLPYRIDFRPEIPLLSSGKADRAALLADCNPPSRAPNS
jgi:acyl-CoA synthetase (AMP-forming)/AMP-acid ligase II